MEDALADNGGQDLLDEKGEQNAADGGQVEVVDQEEGAQLEGLAVAHQLPAAEDDCVVDDDEDARLLERRHGGGARLEAEVLGRVAGDELEGLAEDGPEVDAEGPVQRRDRQLLEKRERRLGRHCCETGRPGRRGFN